MSKNKIALSLAVAGILGASSALAETDGAFVGVQFGFGGAKTTNEVCSSGAGMSVCKTDSKSASALRYGFLAGYKQFFTENFGLRYYGVVDYGADFKIDNAIEGGGGEMIKFSPKISALNLSANVDALYNFISNDSLEFGAFGGLSLAYASYKAKNALWDLTPMITMVDSKPAFKDFKLSGFDVGVNVGVRAQIVQKHGVELYGRFAFMENKKEETLFEEEDGKMTQTFKAQQPYQVGLRYTFSF